MRKFLRRLAYQNIFLDTLAQINQLLYDNAQVLLDTSQLFNTFCNNLLVDTHIMEQYISASHDNNDIVKYVIDNLSDEDILNTLFNTIKFDIPPKYYADIHNILDKLNIVELKQFISNDTVFIKAVYDEYELLNSFLNTSNNTNRKRINSLDELLAQVDKKGDEYTIGIEFYMDILVSRDRPWIIIDNEIKSGRQANGHGGLLKEYSDDMYEEEKAYDESMQSNKLEKPFIFGYAKKDVAIIEGILEKDIPAPSFEEVAQILKKKYTKVYNQIKSKNLLVRLAKRIR